MNAKMWVKSEEHIRCRLCSHFCLLSAKNPKGICNVRYFHNGELKSLVDTHIACMQVDPIEKKPLYHFKPKSLTFSLGSVGCNFSCPWCQNHNLVTQANTENIVITNLDKIKSLFGQQCNPNILVSLAKRENATSIAFTYNEPTLFVELVEKLAVHAKKEALNTIFVSNGYFSKGFCDMSKELIDAMNIDIKSFSNETYENYCKAKLKPVLDTCVRVKEHGIHLEVTTLFIPKVNDSEKEMREIAQFIVSSLGKETVWHISAFHPAFLFWKKERTDISVLDKAYQIGKELGLEYIYYGNVPKQNNTICPYCGEKFITRNGYMVDVLNDFSGQCFRCGKHISGVWK